MAVLLGAIPLAVLRPERSLTLDATNPDVNEKASMDPNMVAPKEANSVSMPIGSLSFGPDSQKSRQWLDKASALFDKWWCGLPTEEVTVADYGRTIGKDITNWVLPPEYATCDFFNSSGTLAEVPASCGPQSMMYMTTAHKKRAVLASSIINGGRYFASTLPEEYNPDGFVGTAQCSDFNSWVRTDSCAEPLALSASSTTAANTNATAHGNGTTSNASAPASAASHPPAANASHPPTANAPHPTDASFWSWTHGTALSTEPSADNPFAWPLEGAPPDMPSQSLWWEGQMTRHALNSLGPCGYNMRGALAKKVTTVGNSSADSAGPVIAMHIRRGDACMRWGQRDDGGKMFPLGRPCYKMDAYMGAARELQAQYGANRILLATDSPCVVEEEIQKYASEFEFKFVDFNRSLVSGAANGNGRGCDRDNVTWSWPKSQNDTKAQGHFMEKRNLTDAERVLIFGSFHAEVNLLSTADLLVGTGGATFTQTIFTAMVGARGVQPPFIMVDGHHLI